MRKGITSEVSRDCFSFSFWFRDPSQLKLQTVLVSYCSLSPGQHDFTTGGPTHTMTQSIPEARHQHVIKMISYPNQSYTGNVPPWYYSAALMAQSWPWVAWWTGGVLLKYHLETIVWSENVPFWPYVETLMSSLWWIKREQTKVEVCQVPSKYCHRGEMWIPAMAGRALPSFRERGQVSSLCCALD